MSAFFEINNNYSPLLNFNVDDVGLDFILRTHPCSLGDLESLDGQVSLDKCDKVRFYLLYKDQSTRAQVFPTVTSI